MVVVEAVLPTKIALGATFGGDFPANTVLRAASGEVDTNQPWPYPLWTGKLSYEHLDPDEESDRLTLKAIQDFHATMGGNALAWLFFNRRRFKVKGVKIGVADGSSNDFQLVDIYEAPYSGGDLAVPVTRPIHGSLEVQDHGTLRQNTIVLYNDGDPIDGSDWSLVTTPGSRGKTHFGTPPSGDGDITADFQYCFPCMFTETGLPQVFTGIDVDVMDIAFEQIPDNKS
jgi:hypothetical protein